MTGCRVIVDRSKCTGIGLCEATMPDMFELAGDGLVQVTTENVDIDRRRELEEAALNCPTQAIAIITDAGG